ncbi:MAG TPA: ribokinase [Candidatus Limnocylindrales bacterium]
MLVVGSINVDLVVSVAVLPGRGETVAGGLFAQHQGGKGANQAVAAARMGARVAFVGAVGPDDYGRAALDELRAEGIDVSRIAISSLTAESTGIALIIVDGRGQNQIAVASGANARVDGRFVSKALRDSPVAGSVLLSNFEVRDDAVVAGAQFGAASGMTLLVNPAPARAIASELIALRPILIPNELEAEALTGERDPVAAGRLLAARTGNTVIVTIGARGAVIVTTSAVEHIPVPYVEVLDTTGAGDTFCGALAAEIAAGSDLSTAARVAVRAASLSTTAGGARGAMPTRAMVG